MSEHVVDAVSEAHLRIALVPGLGPVLTRRLLAHFGGPVEICGASAERLSHVEGIGRGKADLIRRAISEANVEAELDLIRKHGVTPIAFDDPAYPPLLRHIIDPPPLLFVRGQIAKQDAVALAVVGSRQCSGYGREQADRLSALCSQAGLTIVSGGARGIDSAAHRAALRVKGRTIAVLGCGLSVAYPPENRELFDAIADGGGAVVSELPMAAPPIAEHFPARNRIISGLSLGVLVVEASQRSGALITARLAAEEHHREVMALPGRVDSAASAGCHKILREGWATLVTSPADIMDCLGEAGQTLKAALEPMEEASKKSVKEDAPLFAGALPGGSAQQLLSAITLEPVTLDALCDATGLPISAIQSQLMQLQITGLIDRLPGNRVKRRH